MKARAGREFFPPRFPPAARAATPAKPPLGRGRAGAPVWPITGNASVSRP